MVLRWSCRFLIDFGVWLQGWFLDKFISNTQDHYCNLENNRDFKNTTNRGMVLQNIYRLVNNRVIASRHLSEIWILFTANDVFHRQKFTVNWGLYPEIVPPGRKVVVLHRTKRPTLRDCYQHFILRGMTKHFFEIFYSPVDAWFWKYHLQGRW